MTRVHGTLPTWIRQWFGIFKHWQTYLRGVQVQWYCRGRDASWDSLIRQLVTETEANVVTLQGRMC